MNRRALLLTFASLLLVIFSATRAEACSCMMPGPPCQEFSEASAVFVGTVTGIKTAPRDEAEQRDAARRVTFAVKEAFSGVKGKQASVWTGFGGGDCGYSFDEGASYLVYASARPDGRLYTGICTRTRPASAAASDVAFLRALARRTSGVTFSGRVGRLLDKWDESGERTLEPLKGVRVTVVGRAGRREARTDARGRYELTGFPSGPYEIMVHLPGGLTTDEPKRMGQAADRGCVSADFYITDTKPK